jgi:integrase
MFNFWSQGLRIGDCLRLKWGNIQDDVISLKMEKTDIGLTIPLNDSNIHRLKWFISEKDLFPIWNWEKKEWNNYFPIPNEEKNEIEKITTPFPLDILSSIENSYQYDWLNMIEELKDKEFEYYYIDQMSDFRPKDRYGYEYHSYFKSKNPHLFETLNERLMIFNKELKLVINKISKDENYRNQFIFPFLRGYENERDLTKFSNKISSSVSLINKSLKEISKIVGIEKKISNHWSRHTITSISKSLGVDLYELKNWLGHTSVKTTESYVNTITTHSSIKNTKNVKNLLENPNSI